MVKSKINKPDWKNRITNIILVLAGIATIIVAILTIHTMFPPHPVLVQIQIMVKDADTGNEIDAARVKGQSFDVVTGKGGITSMISIRRGESIEVTKEGYERREVVVSGADILNRFMKVELFQSHRKE